jgi:DNA-binding MarR family transcriptional regulator
MARHGLSGKQYNVLRIIRRGGGDGLPVSRIAGQMVDPRADVTRLMDRLERDGFIERLHDRQDRRVVLVSLTGKGTATLAALDRPLVDLHRSQFAHLEREEIVGLTALLQKVRKSQ